MPFVLLSPTRLIPVARNGLGSIVPAARVGRDEFSPFEVIALTAPAHACKRELFNMLPVEKGLIRTGLGRKGRRTPVNPILSQQGGPLPPYPRPASTIPREGQYNVFRPISFVEVGA